MARMKGKNKMFMFLIFIGVGLILLGTLFKQETFIDTKYVGTKQCDFYKGCTSSDILSCETSASTAEKTGWNCDSCIVRCGADNVVKVREQDFSVKCQSYTNFGAMVEVSAKCSLSAPKSHAKTLCSDSSAWNVFKYYDTDNQQWEGKDVYYANEIDQLEERIESCDYACRQVDQWTAECVDSEDAPNNYIPYDHKSCYAWGGRNEVWWYDNENVMSQRVEICPELCQNGKCVSAGTGGSGGTTPPVTPPAACSFGACTQDEFFECNDGEKIKVYECLNGCYKPLSSACSGGTPGSGGTGGGDKPVVSDCKLYEESDLAGNCEFSMNSLSNGPAFKQFIKDNGVMVAIGAGVFVILLALFIRFVLLKR